MLMAIFALLVLWPLFLALALWIKLDSKGPVFFQQTRVGRYERNFKILKFHGCINPFNSHLTQIF